MMAIENGSGAAGAQGPGERREKAARSRRSATIAALFAAGMPCGAYLGYTLARNDFDVAAPWSPAIALLIAAIYLLAMGFGSFMLSKQMDEVERVTQYQAVAAAGSAYLVVYPVWFVLWKGGFVVEPIHWVLFVAFWVVLALASLYYRYR